MRNLCLIDNNINSEKSLVILSFFRMIGVYVREIHLSKYNNTSYKFDMTVSINNEDKIIYVESENAQKKINETEASRDIINKLLDFALSNKIMLYSEFESSKYVADVYFSNNYMKTHYKCNYYFSANYDNNVKVYNNIIRELMSLLHKIGISKWGENRYERVQFAIAYVTCELGKYCTACNKRLEIDPKQLISVLNWLDEISCDFLSNSIKILKAEVYSKIIIDKNEAYEVLKRFNKYSIEFFETASFMRGKYYFEVTDRYEIAEANFSEAVSRNKDCYKALYMLGFMNSLCKKQNDAINNFSKVIDMLLPKLKEKCILPIELEYLFLSYKNLGNLSFETDAGSALKYYRKAMGVYEHISECEFYSLITNDSTNRISMVKEARQRLSINQVVIMINECKNILEI